MSLLCLASAAERRAPLPGDTLIPDPMGVWTHAISIRRAPADVWPWLVQIGAGRAGWYSYDILDNAGNPSASEILPDCQEVNPGDILPAVPGAEDAFQVVSVEPDRGIVLIAPADADPPTVSWAFRLEPAGRGGTRLIVRARASTAWRDMARASGSAEDDLAIDRIYRVLGRLPTPLLIRAAGFGHWFMERKMLRGIRGRAEESTWRES